MLVLCISFLPFTSSSFSLKTQNNKSFLSNKKPMNLHMNVVHLYLLKKYIIYTITEYIINDTT